jgi:hypothetical protein
MSDTFWNNAEGRAVLAKAYRAEYIKPITDRFVWTCPAHGDVAIAITSTTDLPTCPVCEELKKEEKIRLANRVPIRMIRE